METLAVDIAGFLGPIWNALCVMLGLGLVIFFHELGHFAVAKWCDVHVERFSIGFGPILWSRQKGETEYALSAVPFGGYVKMLGQDDMDASKTANEEIAENPRSYSAKKVWQRMAIISAGVVMNIITACLFYAAAYGLGVMEPPPVVGGVSTGSPAWTQGLRLGDEITHVNGEKMATFTDLSMDVALSSGDVQLKGVRANGTMFETKITPDSSEGMPQIGVFPIQNHHVIRPLKDDDPVTMVGFPAEEADPPFLPGDTIVGLNGEKIENFASVKKILSEQRAKPAVFELQRLNEDGSAGETVTTTVEALKFRSLGLSMEMGPIAAIQSGSAAERAKLQVGDVIKTVDGKSVGTEIDPMQLPDLLQELSKRAEPIPLVVRRKIEGSGDSDITLEISPTDRPGWATGLSYLSEPLPAPAIGAAFFVDTRIALVKPGSEADRAGDIEAGQKITKLEFVSPDGKESDALELKHDDKDDAKKPVNWALAFWNCQVVPDKHIVLHIQSGDKSFAKTLKEFETEDTMYMPIRGFKTESLEVQQKANSVGEAFVMGYKSTKKNILQIYLTLRGLFTGRISVKNLQGPVGIAQVGYAVAKQGPSRLMIFLGFLSVNLAVLNFLPIPVLDGGHMVFLTYEAVAGKKPSEKVLIIAQYVGLIMILGLMVFVVGQDVSRLFS